MTSTPRSSVLAIAATAFLAVTSVSTAQRGTGFVRWTDPRENAFCLEIPRGWRVQGGMFRVGNQPRPMFEVVSPDGRIRICCGDNRIPCFQEPTPMLASLGFREGQMNGSTMISRFTTGDRIAVQFAQSKLAGGPIRVRGGRRRPDLEQQSRREAAAYERAGFRYTISAAEISFSAGRHAGYAVAETSRCTMAGGQGAIWLVTKAYGFVCDPSAEPTARQVLEHMVATVQTNPQWQSMEQRSQANISRIVQNGIRQRADIQRRSANEISDIQRRGWQNRQVIRDRTFRKANNALRGTIDLRDPTTGERFNAWDSHTNYYWRRNHTNQVLGTNSTANPPSGWSQARPVR